MFGTDQEENVAADRLRQTDITQPALFLHSQAAMRLLAAAGRTPDAVAGHSLGEYSALSAAGAISFEDGLRIVRLRGQLMARAGDRRPGTMAAIIGLDDGVVEQICTEVSTDDAVAVAANYNSPGQVVISGDPAAVEDAMEQASRSGARRVIPLSVSGAFHSPLMTDAREGLAEALEKLDINTPEVPVYLNVSAEPTRDPDVIRQGLLDQLESPVRWSQTLKRMAEDGHSRFVEVGAGKVLLGLARRTLGRDIDTAPAGTASDLEALVT
jgi:[acyl-carrier-protein] S-malonyltransferase